MCVNPQRLDLGACWAISHLSLVTDVSNSPRGIEVDNKRWATRVWRQLYASGYNLHSEFPSLLTVEGERALSTSTLPGQQVTLFILPMKNVGSCHSALLFLLICVDSKSDAS